MKFSAVTGAVFLLASMVAAMPNEPENSVQDAAAKVAEPVKHLAEGHPVLEKRKKGGSHGGGSRNHTENAAASIVVSNAVIAAALGATIFV
ncbi:hypothetical protein H112_02902 [Trichophyton rubrum D6]|uniref:Uncharacterized protein n=5 Tax=Trichophyton TaxID=5550 RepID=A0A178EW78_TRIRU|nr:uncharacterized protein TERG_05528 [Trichophyton rubrum CBS 118892]EZF24598.1 hypothetical protein H100_02906 [Trichophyton rubrum MR850]EZF43631.1 hypothetical protein H102_02899 [Trichophyton rubrum CBS 100081]EZF54254.1 hypothetical protein H103_02913 [Trichophyton rubrum CBS 288.86]EZF64873.1 hypothetical protein H104_02892 [Trichophyton rubrum CBS 289.86]EZF75499.1 hypothetical protein H105_02919 [Trichophyton soudanense CBS 452.61]EZF86166.1 hypothetical protein H110_02914 [Trichophy